MKLIRFITAFVLIVALSLVTVVASTEKEPVSSGYIPAEEELVERLLYLGVITENNASLDSNVSRADMAKMAVDFINISEIKSGNETSVFTDVEPGSNGAEEINLLFDLGYISGQGDNLFHPLRAATLDEATVFIMNAAGYKIVAESGGGYPYGYRKIAADNDLYAGVKATANEPVTLLDVYKLIENSLDMPALVIDSVSGEGVGYTVYKDYTLLNEFHDIYEGEGIVTGNDETTLISHDTGLTEGQIEIDGVVYNSIYECGDYIGSYVTYYFRQNKKSTDDFDTLIYMEKKSSRNSQLVLEAEDIVKEQVTGQRVYYRDEDYILRSLDVKTNVSVILNGKCYHGYGMLNDVIPDYGIVKLIDNDNDSIIDVINITSYENVVVKSVDVIKGEIENRLDNSVMKINTERDRVTVVNEADGTPADLSDIKVWDVLTVSASKNSTGRKKIDIHIVRDTVKGKVEALGKEDGKQLITINNNEYKCAIGFSENLNVGKRGTFYLDYRGNIVAFRSGEDDGRIYGIFYGAEKEGGLDTVIQCKIFDEYGEWVIYDIKKKVTIDGVIYDTEKNGDSSYVLGGLNRGELIRFTLSDENTIIAIDTERADANASQGTLKQICSDKSVYYRDSIFYSTEDGSFFAVNDDTVMFGVPEDLSDELAYTTSVGSFKTQTLYTWSYKAYAIGESNIDIATAMVFNGLGSSGSVEDYTTFSVIKEFKWAMDEDGQRRQKIVFANKGADGNGVFVADNVRDSATGSVENIDYFKLQPNDIIQYAVNDKGMINDILLIYRYDTQNGTLTPGELDPESGNVDNRFNSSQKSIDANGRHVYATVEVVEDGYIKFFTKVSSLPQLANVADETVVYRVSKNNARGLPVLTTVDSIRENDTVVCRLQTLTAKEIFIIE